MNNKQDEIKFNKEIYPIEFLERAAYDYGSICSISIKEDKDYYKCIFNSNKYDLTQIKDEFCNYLIELMNEQVNV